MVKLKAELEECEESIKANAKSIEEKLPFVKEKTADLREKHNKFDVELSKHIVVENEIAGNVLFYFLIIFFNKNIFLASSSARRIK